MSAFGIMVLGIVTIVGMGMAAMVIMTLAVVKDMLKEERK